MRVSQTFSSTVSTTGYPERYIPALTGLRALAAYLVFLHHYNPAISGTLIHSLVDQGYVGVSIFFVLCGFLIYHRYAHTYLSQKNWSYWYYLCHRFARIYPLYNLLLLLTIGVYAWAGHPMSLWLLGLNIILLKGLFESTKFSGISQSWSLTVELCFYGLAPLLFTGLQRWGAFQLTIRLISVGLFLGLLTSQTEPTENLSFFLFYTFLGRSFEFVLGMELARRWHQNQLAPTQNALRVGLLLMVYCLIWQACLNYYLSDHTLLLISEVIIYNGLLPIGICLVLQSLIQQKTVMHLFFAQPTMQVLGRGSYAFYLIHIGVVANGLQRIGVTNRWLLFGLLVGMAQGLHYFIERPLSNFLCSKAARSVSRLPDRRIGQR